tara:strand:+ start:318 stop:767 length:450 start_codon:yes stop_codon:yes gene_type:complete
MEELPFELKKYHKYYTIQNWKKRGLKETDETIVEIYEGSIRTSHCELCGNAFKSSRNRHMDHDHITGKFRNIVCSKCNHNKSDRKVTSNTGYIFISKVECSTKKYKQGFYYQIKIYRNSKYVLKTCRKTLEEAIEIRDKFLEENPDLFT